MGQASAPAARVPDAQNPAAQAFATMRLRQLVRAGLLGGMPQGGDPAATWRGLSATLGQNPQALQSFLAAGQQAAHVAPPMVSDAASGGGYPAPAPGPAPAMVSDAASGGGYGHGSSALAQMQAALQHLPPSDVRGGAAHMIANASPRHQLNTLASAKAVAATMQHLRKLRPYNGPH